MAKKTIGVIATTENNARGVPIQRAARSYLDEVAQVLDAQPLIIPAIPGTADIGHLVGLLDGIVLTGARPNVHPEEYGEAETPAHGPFDRGRDRVAMDLVRACVETGTPVFGICRGFQEMAVAYGSTLHPEIRDLPGRMNHRMDPDETDRDVIYAPRHGVRLEPGGVFAGLYGRDEIRVNTLHGQGVMQIGGRIAVEGVAEDGTPEALVVQGAKGFALGVQWHAEYRPGDDPVNRVLWQAFRAAL